VRSCRTASVVASAALVSMIAVSACRGEAARPEVPPVTSASPDAGRALANGGAPSPATPADGGGESAPSRPVITAPAESPVKAKFVDTPARLEAGACQRALVAVVKGKVTALNETLSAGDVLVVAHGQPFDASGAGTVVWAMIDLGGECAVSSHPAIAKTVIRSTAAPELRWAGGTMSAHLDVATPPKAPASGVSPELYLGRLEGTAPVVEHDHAGSWEILAAVEANGTFTVDGTEARLAARQIVMIPPGSKHAWKPEPGSKLVAIQMYSPPGPEQRFVGLAAADKGAGAGAVKDAGARDAR
jgi:mannose-6-phosphate isomerase-like protein (cupin superfamily)